MCGICGTFGITHAGDHVARMLEQMHHRGPDGEGTLEIGPVILGHRRLAIVDLSDHGRQPMQTPDGRISAIVNGEIYNYPDLRKELEAQGTTFTSDCDSEVVLHAYATWGRDAFARLNGMFAFALWDDAAQDLFLVRDRLGIKPLYYRHHQGQLTFASEIRALVSAGAPTTWRISADGLAQYLRFQNMVGAHSLFEGVEMVAPGQWVQLNSRGLNKSLFWEPQFQTDTEAPFEQTVDTFGETFRQATERHLMSDVPVASYLSSGFDSTMVATIASDLSERPVATFTGHFDEGGWYDESAGAQLVADAIGSGLTKVAIGPTDFQNSFDEMVFSLDEPRMGIGALSQFIVARRAAEDFKLILTGHGGDELFSGYPVFKLAAFLDIPWSRPLAKLRLLVSAKLSELPHLVYFALRSGTKDAGSSFLPQLFSDRQQSQGLLPRVRETLRVCRPAKSLNDLSSSGANRYETLLLTYLRAYLPGLLVVEDKISMAHSLESRTPLLDNEMVALSLGTPPDVKLNEGELKSVIKKSASGILPKDLFSLPKRGFPIPLRLWLRGPLHDWMRERIAGPKTPLTRFFQRAFLEQTVDGYVKSWSRFVRPLDEIPTHRIWMLLCLESWLRQYEDRLGIVIEPPIVPTEH